MHPPRKGDNNNKLIITENKVVNLFGTAVAKWAGLRGGIKLTEGQSLSLKCHVRGWPLPEVTWYKNNMTIEAENDVDMTKKEERIKIRIENVTNDKGILSETEFLSVLEIEKVEEGDRALYTCVAFNLVPLPCYRGLFSPHNCTVMVRVGSECR